VSDGPRYLVLLMRRPDFDTSLVEPHLAFLEALRAQGLLELNGGFADGTGGAYLLRGLDGLEAAHEVVARDPLAIHAASDITILEWNAR
jgi:uncharacterized protein YciI